MTTFSFSHRKGFTLLTAIVTTGILLIVSFAVVNVVVKQLLLSYTSQESQYAFYAADSGVECALYWDTHAPNGVSAFDVNNPSGSVLCGNTAAGENTIITTGSQTIQTPPTTVQSRIGGGAFAIPQTGISIFQVNLPKGCVIVQVKKTSNVTDPSTYDTQIDSRGYNTCDITSSRRFERGITVKY